jgi:hypothetical protein
MKRNAEEIKKIEEIIVCRKSDAVLLNGSRANTRLKPDPLQDFDIIYLVNDLESFI